MRGNALLLSLLICLAPATGSTGQVEAPFSTPEMRPAAGSPLLNALDGDAIGALIGSLAPP